MTTTRSRIIALIAVYTERYVLSLVFLWFARSPFERFIGLIRGQITPDTTMVVDATHQLTLLLLCVITSLLLLLGHRAAVPPQRLKLVLVPLAATFYNFLYFTVTWFPKAWQMNLAPKTMQLPLLAVGMACIFIGPTFAFWSILHLGRSFGIYVTLRKVVATGPYRWVRHPMYLGWICAYIGVALANFSGAYLLLVTANISLVLYRAQMEEKELANNSPEYAEYRSRTRFIIPRLRNPFSG